ncbi:hypothetical protein J7E96_02000 [Streptomyces sp. ISL-96]|nr:hypothetical protein [Streptomyces sp. ISL-96]
MTKTNRPYRRITLQAGQLVYDPASEMVGVVDHLVSSNIAVLKRPWGNTFKANKCRLRAPTEHQRRQYASLVKLARDRAARTA